MKKNRYRWDDPIFTEAVRHIEKAYALSREHSAVTKAALEKYGDEGPQISGVIRDHFPKEVKEKLRSLCDEMNWHSKRADECRPPRVRGSTMRALRNFIRERDGKGFYL